VNREERLEIGMSAAVAAGKLLVDRYHDNLSVSQKESLRDVVTEVDRLAEQRIIEIIRSASGSEPMVTEESGDVAGVDGDGHWVIDALDGTVNYVNRIPFFAVSVAFVEEGRATVGVVYNPMQSDLYYGAEGLGAFKNQAPLVNQDGPPEESLFAAAFSGKSHDPAARPEEFLLFGQINDSTRGCLRTGSAAMNLALVAEGRLGGCWGKANKLWDMAGGLLLAGLAGARVATVEVDPNRHLISYLATAPSTWDFVHERAAGVLGLDA
jgi:myo-inositol-1(or 4)-monophosphatase